MSSKLSKYFLLLSGLTICLTKAIAPYSLVDLSNLWNISYVQELRSSFDNLADDPYMTAEHSGTRQRAFARFAFDFSDQSLVQLLNIPYAPRYNDHNQYQNGMPRLFEPVSESTAKSPVVAAAIRYFSSLLPDDFKTNKAEVKMNQIRILVQPGNTSAEPTPEGIHRDGETYIGVLVINRINVQGGEVTVWNKNGTTPLFSFISQPLQGYLIDDFAVKHSVSSIVPIDPTKPCSRDILIFNFNPLLD